MLDDLTNRPALFQVEGVDVANDTRLNLVDCVFGFPLAAYLGVAIKCLAGTWGNASLRVGVTSIAHPLFGRVCIVLGPRPLKCGNIAVDCARGKLTLLNREEPNPML